MKEFWLNIGTKMRSFLVWSLDNHPGKFIGTSVGLILGLFMITLGLWRTLVLALFAAIGFLIGKRQDDYDFVTNWLERNLKKF